MKAKPKKTYSQRQLRADLAALREDVAAPRDFRAKLLAQLSGQAAPKAGAGFWQGLWDFVSRPSLASAVVAAFFLGFGLWAAFVHQAVQLEPVALSIPAAGVGPSKAPSQLARAKAPQKSPQTLVARAASLPAAPQVQAFEHQQVGGQGPAQGQGAAEAVSSQSQLKFSGVPAGSLAAPSPAAVAMDFGAKPTVIVVLPTVTPMANALQGNSQVRRNKFLASRGEYADILFQLKDQGHVRIECYDRNGRLVGVLDDSDHPAGTFEVRWYGFDGQGQMSPTGIYLVRVIGPGYDERHKVVLIR
jgi:hypothetical protein